MNYIRKKSWVSIFSIIMAVLVFNMSIDPPDLLQNLDDDIELEEDLSINEVETFYEFVMEKCFDIDNAVPETDDPDSDNLVKKYNLSVKQDLSNALSHITAVVKSAVFCPLDTTDIYQLFAEKASPPPKNEFMTFLG